MLMSELLKLDLFSNSSKEDFNKEDINKEDFNQDFSQEDQTTTTYIPEEGTSEEQLMEQLGNQLEEQLVEQLENQLGDQTEDKIEVSRHAYERLHERCGLSRKAATRMAEKAFYIGMKHSDTKGQINRWITSLYFNNKNANNIRLYGNFAYIFCKKNPSNCLRNTKQSKEPMEAKGSLNGTSQKWNLNHRWKRRQTRI